ncbi:hypothetical protein GUITHDRAFT_155567 [Guillardia theta CCMP2712]|uniref:Myb-like domain-containing protein n=1 Tax=Guillardia theta (strain CCMP2712) TaxID=905079 RepID=L1IFT6_GUITC|nr:hypothetical protein GUITHDRAFT_155567 [Guillardia theta CCMP2712]EKX35126.1 hypothetical protein GUITHDRAFT_155567 [Guillardia theta CCMP2712]|eukprot:XP_005822106.1 hypothetical protein GUITHDRAFT_155567 [Guillardia theta CCMP2712]
MSTLFSAEPQEGESVDQAVQILTDQGFSEQEIHLWISSFEQHESNALSHDETRFEEHDFSPDKKQPCLPRSENKQDEVEQIAVETLKKKCTKWTAEEHLKFVKALDIFLPSYDSIGRINCNTGQVCVGLGVGVAAKIASYIGTRTAVQVRSHAQKYFLRANKLCWST